MAPRIVCLFLFFCLSLFLSACSQTPPEEAIRANISATQTAIEEKKSSRVLEFVTDDFIGNNRFDKPRLRQLLIGIFLQHQNINVIITSIDIELNSLYSDRASMQATAVVTGAKRLIPDEGRIFHLLGEWQLIENQWLLKTLDWE